MREKEGKTGKHQGKGKVRDTVTGEYEAVTADSISGSNLML